MATYRDSTIKSCLHYEKDYDDTTRGEYYVSIKIYDNTSAFATRHEDVKRKFKKYSGQSTEELLQTLIEYEDLCAQYPTHYTTQRKWRDLTNIFEAGQLNSWRTLKKMREDSGITYNEDGSDYDDAVNAFIAHECGDDNANQTVMSAFHKDMRKPPTVGVDEHRKRVEFLIQCAKRLPGDYQWKENSVRVAFSMTLPEGWRNSCHMKSQNN